MTSHPKLIQIRIFWNCLIRTINGGIWCDWCEKRELFAIIHMVIILIITIIILLVAVSIIFMWISLTMIGFIEIKIRIQNQANQMAGSKKTSHLRMNRSFVKQFIHSARDNFSSKSKSQLNCLPNRRAHRFGFTA